MPHGPFAHVCLLVNDLDASVENWTKILGVLDAEQVERPLVRYDDFEGGDDQMKWVTFVSEQGAEIQLCEPAPGTPLARRLEKRGEGVHHLCFTVPDVPAALKELDEAGLDVDLENTYSDPNVPWQEWSWVLPTSANGVLVEVAKPYRADGTKWAPAGEAPAAG